jgi:hypothetical protein
LDQTGDSYAGGSIALRDMDELAAEDPMELMNPELGKWGKIARVINTGKQDEVDRDGPAYKYKWSTLLSDFKKIGTIIRELGGILRSISKYPSWTDVSKSYPRRFSSRLTGAWRTGLRTNPH